MGSYFHLFLAIPILGFLASLFVREKNEQWISYIAFSTALLNLLLAIIFAVLWIFNGSRPLNYIDLSVYHNAHYNFYFDFYFDYITATFIVTGAVISFMVVMFSRYYMHRESGYKRFFNTIIFFYIGYTLTLLAGNFETLFIGWEILGISSFLLISFYRLRYLPVKNAFRVFTIYRIGDVGILLAMWMSHHLFENNVMFAQLTETFVSGRLELYRNSALFITLMVLLAALAKSAQFPISSWLPRAMEGPTPSSAIFYGSLSVHIGAYLLLRTYPIWDNQIYARWIIAFFGFVTAVLCANISKVQATIKGQIAYSSASQIGIIFIEIAAGWHVIALIHFVSNAFLRTYQLLISPSAVSYLVREQFYSFKPDDEIMVKPGFMGRLRATIYNLSIKEWYLDSLVYWVFFRPLKWLRLILGFITLKLVFFFMIPVYLLAMLIINGKWIDYEQYKTALGIAFGTLALLMVAKSFNERKSSRLAWILVVLAHFYIDLAVTFNDLFDYREASIYLIGIIISGTLGYVILQRIRNLEKRKLTLNGFQGLVTKYRMEAFAFLLCCLGISGFPITPTFLGEDLILTHIGKHDVVMAAIVSITFILNGMAVIRIYTRIFLGGNTRNYQLRTDLTI